MGEDQPLRLTRRAFLLGAAALAGEAYASPWRGLARRLALSAPEAEIQGAIIGPAHALGHRLRQGGFPSPSRERRADVAVVGGGIAGLSAAWKLDRSGLKDFALLELEEQPGGNSRWGESPVSPHPWGAHYIPFPSPEARAVSELLRELGVELGRDARGRPVYDERYVCFAPAERLFIHGRWQEGLFPRLGASSEDLRQHAAFEARMAALRELRDREGRRAFAIPMELSSRREDLLALDRISMAQWLRREGFDSPRLRWYVEYCCRDDFGTLLDHTSAWAGIHYFASRGEGVDDQVLTWPEGNGWIARRLAARAGERLTPSALAFRVEQDKEGVLIDYLDARRGETVRLRSRAAIVCLPRFATERVVVALSETKSPSPWRYSPWMVANLALQEPPAGRGAPPAWDNVLYNSDSLGYVRATHQSLSQDERASVWTYYRPFAGPDPGEARRRVYERPWTSWRDEILADLSRAHPGLEARVRRIDVMLWGHGMVRPEPGFVWGRERERAAQPLGRVFFGHSDLSGFSLFEEAQYRGVRAAEAAMARLGRPFSSSL